jgi:hemolysin activation/secretion protein
MTKLKLTSQIKNLNTCRATSMTSIESSFLLVVLGLASITCFNANASQAGAVPLPNLDQQRLPALPNKKSLSGEAGGVSPNEAPSSDVEYNLAFPIRKFETNSNTINAGIEKLLHRFSGAKRYTAEELSRAQADVWDTLRKQGQLTRVELKVIPGSNEQDGSSLLVNVTELTVGEVTAQAMDTTETDSASLDQLVFKIRGLLNSENKINLNKLDEQLLKIAFLRDREVKVSINQLSLDTVELKLLVSTPQPQGSSVFIQYDNYGFKSFGQNRLISAISKQNTGLVRGDSLDLLGVKSEGLFYGKFNYELPFSTLGSVVAFSGSYTEYKSQTGVYGKSFQPTMGVRFPIHLEDKSKWTGLLNYSKRFQQDYTASSILTNDKIIENLQQKIQLQRLLDDQSILNFDFALNLGKVDLTRSASALSQDASSAKTNGGFGKIQWNLLWTKKLSSSGSWNFNFKTTGQMASKNLDQSEKLSLGGSSGVRGYGPNEAMGDEASISNVELAYTIPSYPWIQFLGFYDHGRTRTAKQPWTVGNVPNEYSLKSAGLGLSAALKNFNASVVFARQLGANPGLVNGLDSDGLNNKYRPWLSVSWQN